MRTLFTILGIVTLFYSHITPIFAASRPYFIFHETPFDPRDARPLPQVIRSRLSFSKDKKTVEIHYADISIADSLGVCPLETLPPSLKVTLDEMVTQIKQATSKIKEIEDLGCKTLQSRLESAQTQIGDALRYRFIANSSAYSAANPVQNEVNFQVQQASAVNMMLLTASDMFRRECIQTLVDKVTVQKLIGQIVTLSGLTVGGWQGLVTATAGQLITHLPIFQRDIDQALEIIKIHEAQSQRGSFLCLYRQMQKMNSLLFAKETDQVIDGFDLTYATGPAHETEVSLKDLNQRFPDFFQDVLTLSSFFDKSTELIAELKKTNAFLAKDGLLYANFEKAVSWCHQLPIQSLQSPLVTQALTAAIHTTTTFCEEIKSASQVLIPEAELSRMLQSGYFGITALRQFYALLRVGSSDFCEANPENNTICSIAKTWESKKYFENLKKSFDDYRNSDTGNQTRINFDEILSNLGELLAKTSFQKIFEYDHRKLIGYRWYHFFNEPAAQSTPFHQRVLRAMVDLCQTLDPTLAHLFVNAQRKSNLQNQWLNYCVGPQSRLCKSVLKSDDPEHHFLDQLLGDMKSSRYRIYFNSLCGL